MIRTLPHADSDPHCSPHPIFDCMGCYIIWSDVSSGREVVLALTCTMTPETFHVIWDDV
jgi:hypothetical protein